MASRVQAQFHLLRLFIVLAISVLGQLPSVTAIAAPLAGKDSSDDRVTVLGQPCENPYVVAIPTSSPALLERVQSLLPAAFLTTSQFGLYVQAGSFPEFHAAEHLSRQLRQSGLDARVIYKPLPCLPQMQP